MKRHCGHTPTLKVQATMLNGPTRLLEKAMTPDKEYVTKTELAVLTGYNEQTISNKIWEGVFKEGVHFFRPTRRHPLLNWPTVEKCIRGEEG
jgi:hypothetical protein